MLTRIIQWSGKNPALVLLATLFVIIGGIFAVIKTPLDALGFTMVLTTVSGSKLSFAIDTIDPETLIQAETHWAFSSLIGLHFKGLVPTSATGPLTVRTPQSAFFDGVSLPPVLHLSLAPAFPFTVVAGYADSFQVQVLPVITGRPSGVTAVTLAAATYADKPALIAGLITALTQVGFVSGDNGFLRVDTVSGGLILSLSPEASYESSAASLALTNGRSSAPALTGATYTTVELRDYDYTLVRAWYTANPSPGSATTPTFPTNPPRIFYANNYSASIGTVYDGNLVLDGTI